jgi:hypothetical protein
VQARREDKQCDRSRGQLGEEQRRLHQQWQACVVHRAHGAAGALVNVILRDQPASGDQRFVRTIVVGEIQIAVERDRMSDCQIVRFIARAGIGAVRDESEQNQRHDCSQHREKP